jgi:hypothetical protein
MEQVGYIKDHWTVIYVPDRIMLDSDARNAVRTWLINVDSPGKFYAGFERYWFERPEDAAMYALKC